MVRRHPVADRALRRSGGAVANAIGRVFPDLVRFLVVDNVDNVDDFLKAIEQGVEKFEQEEESPTAPV
jgi:hypothetical protein